jgi:thioredoxin reductase (NADPH)
MLSQILHFLSDHLALVGFLSIFLVAAWRISLRKRHSQAAKRILQDAVQSQLDEPLTLHPEINASICSGCAACTQVCPEGDILKIIDHKAVLVSPTRCMGHGECERSCPTGAISLVFGTKTKGMEIPRTTTNYETNVPGLYVCGELGGMGLIRNAFRQGHWAATHAVENLKPGVRTNANLLIVGAGPAGLAAALTADSKKASYICIEQNSFGGTIANFPRQKVVMSHPAEVPGIWKMQFPKNRVSKEELLKMWQDIKLRKALKVREKTKFESLEKHDAYFSVKTSQGVITAQKVLLCMGVRGTPRRLELKNEDLPKVTYNLIDPDQYKRQDIVVVGGGNAGVEAAQQLGKEKYGNKVILLVRGPSLARCNESNQKIIQEMASKGLVEIWFNAEVKEIHEDTLLVKKQEELLSIPNDYLFVFAGAEVPFKFLSSLGIEIEKKFGTKRGG